MNSISTILMLVVAGTLTVGCSTELAPTTGATERAAAKRQKVTRIIVNGRSASVGLLDAAGTNGFLTVTQDQIANTTGLDFGWATPDATNPDLMNLFQGAGQIPNSSFTDSGSSARLSLTTPADFAVYLCVININTGDYTCAPTGPLVFDLTWLQNGYGSIHEQSKSVQTLGPVTTKVDVEYTMVTATVNGTWGGRSSPDLSGNLTDAGGKTYIREITVAY